VIGDNCLIGPGSLVENATLGANVSVMHSVVREAHVGNDVAIGPFAHLRPAADVGDGCRIGNFVEVKKSQLGAGTKVNHLSYIGDAKLGDKVNVGAGTITANYDGVNKHRTVIGSNSKTGANSVLVAPVTVGERATIGAGSTITKDVADGALAIGRARQMTKEGWAERTA
jgi:bifunctional UDP-N-acetylglucosamine pyrophosphorylase/glucosamine-1-phosphate N-acetyltransferase